jgi:hypothetical protein
MKCVMVCDLTGFSSSLVASIHVYNDLARASSYSSNPTIIHLCIVAGAGCGVASD